MLFVAALIPALIAPSPAPAVVSAPSSGKFNVLMIAVDDLRPQFGKSFATPEVLTPHIDKFFIDGGGSAMQRSYVQIAVCGPSRASLLTSRRPDTTYVGTMPPFLGDWCWCQRTNCSDSELFMTLPTYFRQHGYVSEGNGVSFHSCKGFHN